MKCWKCGQENVNGTVNCINCGVSLERTSANTPVGRAMRELYDRYGCQMVLTNPTILKNGLGDFLENTNMNRILRTQIGMVMDAGVGMAYYEQLKKGSPDNTFIKRVKDIITRSCGFGDDVTIKIMGYFDEMIGWKAAERSAESPNKKPSSVSPARNKEALVEPPIIPKKSETPSAAENSFAIRQTGIIDERMIRDRERLKGMTCLLTPKEFAAGKVIKGPINVRDNKSNNGEYHLIGSNKDTFYIPPWSYINEILEVNYNNRTYYMTAHRNPYFFGDPEKENYFNIIYLLLVAGIIFLSEINDDKWGRLLFFIPLSIICFIVLPEVLEKYYDKRSSLHRKTKPIGHYKTDYGSTNTKQAKPLKPLSPFERTWLKVSVVLTFCYALLAYLKNGFVIAQIVLLAIPILMIIVINSPKIPYVSALVAGVGGFFTGYICGCIPAVFVLEYFDTSTIQTASILVMTLLGIYLAVKTCSIAIRRLDEEDRKRM